jgi:deoxyribodipyrimidine photo-lyase
MSNVNTNRIRILKDDGSSNSGPIIYWMSRDQRVNDNWSLLYAIEKSKQLNKPLIVIFTLAPAFGVSNLRHYDFMLKGLVEIERNLAIKGFKFLIINGDPAQILANYININEVTLLVSDFDPLKVKREWKSRLNSLITIPHHEVDSHNIVPCWIASNKQEFGAYTIRPKIKKLLPGHLTEFPDIPDKQIFYQPSSWSYIQNWLELNNDVKPIEWIIPGEAESRKALRKFINFHLTGYSTRRNDPNENGQSNLSPYLHFGQLSAQRVAIEVMKSPAPEEDKSAFLEELIVRRELSDNYCFYNPDYDSLQGFPNWAKECHRIHRFDKRDYTYSLINFEQSKTHDPLWNAAQKELVTKGKMHGYMRMYWAKKILEWTHNPEEAMQYCIYLNDKYSLDGRDPNGYAGISWSIGGVHDRAWAERSVYGKIRFMNYNGCKRKFNVDKYINQQEAL